MNETMNAGEFLERVRSIKILTTNGQRAPHKPLLLLAFQRLLEGRPRLGKYVEFEKELLPLLKRFYGHVCTQHPEAPFGYLRTDGLWEIAKSDKVRSNDRGLLYRADLVRYQAEGGFPEAADGLLKSNPSLVNQAAAILLANHFPPSRHSDILDVVGLTSHDVATLDHSRTRDPQFRDNVLRAYGRSCSVCRYDIGLDGQLFGLEAAHIRWHSHGGPDLVSNGLALCTFHHKALDAGAIGLKPVGDRFHLLLSSSVHGGSEPLNQLKRFHRQPIRPPQSRWYAPDPAYVRWHHRQVFRHPPMDP